ncbi:hypothetical protein [Bacillus sp. A01H]|uniref:hypothetical protein n=1 Tax=Bacillus TaxID=1386 RepID=UPI0037046A24
MATEHDIVLFFGDNLPDFTGFDEKSIVFLNPMYGDWESDLYQYDCKKSDIEKDKLRKDALLSHN